MKIETTEVLWLDAHQALSLTQVAELTGLSATELEYLVECEALLPLAAAADASGARFSAQCIAIARRASRLRDDFDLDAGAVALLLQLLQRIDDLEAEVHALRAMVPHVLR